MGQYEHSSEEKVRVKLPLIKEDPTERFRDVEIRLAKLDFENQKLQREVGRLKTELSDLRTVVRNLIR